MSGIPEAWVNLPSAETARAVLGSANPYDFGFVPRMVRLVLAHPRIAAAFGPLFQQIMFEPGALSPAEREMVAAVAAAAQDCGYCAFSHAEFFRSEGGDPRLVEAIKEGHWRDLNLSPRERALCAVAEKMSGNPTRMTEEDWQPLRELGFDDQACLEVGHVVGVFNYLTRLADGFGLLLDPQTERAAQTGEALKRPGR